MSEPVVLVLGASGTVGSALTRRLAGDGVAVRALYDPSTPQTPSFPDGVTRVHASFDDARAVRAAMVAADAVFLLTPPSPSQVAWQRTIVDAARAAHVGRIVKLSAFETSADSPLQMGRWHHDGEQALAASGCAWVVLRPQYFMQNLTSALRAAAASGVLAGAADGSTRLGLVDADDIAAVAAVVLTRPGHEGDVLVPTGPEPLSFDEMASQLAEAVGREVRYVQRPAAEVAAQLAARGLPAWHVEDYLKIHGEAASALVTDHVAAVTGRDPTAFATFVRAHVAPGAPVPAHP